MADQIQTGTGLSEAKRALLARRLQGQAASAAEQQIPRRPADQPAQLSFGQERFWFVQHLDPASTTYTTRHVLEVEGPLDMDALGRAYDAVLRRHESLRTTFHSAGGKLSQVVADELRLAVGAVDLRHLPEPERAAEATRLAAEHARTHFDLIRGPLVRLSALRLEDERHLLLLAIHYMVCDKWSVFLFWRDLAACYRAAIGAGDAGLPQMPIQYADYAAWQRRQIGGEVFERQRNYWRGVLGGDVPALQLPADRPRPPVQTYRGALAYAKLPAAASAALLELGAQAGATPYMVGLAAYVAFLGRYSGQRHIRVGAPVANRARPETADIIGLFLNTLVMSADLGDDPSFATLVSRMRVTALDAIANQDLPFEQLVEELRPRRDPSYHPLFQAMFVFLDPPRHMFAAPGVRARQLHVDPGVTKFDVTLFAEQAEDGIDLIAEYNTDLFDASTVDAMLGHFCTLVAAAVAEPHRPISQLPLLGEAERRRLLEAPNRTAAPYPRERGIHQLIERWADETPGADAAVWQGGRMSYAELELRTNRLAHALQAAGVKDGAPVALCAERSPELIVGILGVLKAGGAYVPLDPSYPAERIAMVLADCAAPVLLTQRHLAASLPASGARVICLDDAQDGPAARPAWRSDAGRHAYIIYTSGSTGRPKGVPVTHRQIAHSTSARLGYYPEPARRFLLLSSAAFDSSVAGIFGTLCGGGALCLPAQREEQDVRRVAELVAAFGATDTLCLPSLYQLVLESAAPGELSSLRTVIVAGEACLPALAALHARRAPHAALYNEYGPTEGTVWATVHRVEPDARPGPVPIGRPIANMRAYILDAHLQPAPAGVAGELFLAGEGVVEGYLNQPELTAERFLTVDLGLGAPERLYRTGDLARWLADGTIAFLGRVDQQVKIRGYRIEPGEIEQVILEHGAAQQAAVIAWQPPAERRHAADMDDAELAALLATLGQAEAEALLAGVELLAEEEAGVITRGVAAAEEAVAR